MTDGWLAGGDTDIAEFIGYFYSKGMRQVISTDIAVDGMLAGPSIDMYVSLLERFLDMQLIASGGVSSMSDVDELQRHGIPGVIVGKAIYENRITLQEITAFNLNRL